MKFNLDKMRNQLLILSVLCMGALFVSCNKYTTSVFEPDIAVKPDINDLGDFAIVNTVAATRELYISWSKAENATSYDILINDTLALSHINTTDYSIYNLNPDTDYKISIRAINGALKVKIITKEIRTLKESINEIYQIRFGKYDYSNYRFTQCIKALDGGVVFFRDAEMYGKGYKLVVKTDKDYKIIWHSEIATGTTLVYTFKTEQDIKSCRDGGYLIITKYALFKVSATGELLWRNDDLGNQTFDQLYSGTELSDGNYIGIGTSTRNWRKSIVQEYLLMKVSTDGKTMWKKYAGTTLDNSGYKVAKNRDGNNMLFGRAETTGAKDASTPNQYFNYSTLEFTNDGEVVNERYYKYTYEEFNTDILATNDNCFYLVGMGFRNYGESYIVKIDGDGKFLWDRKGYDDGEYYATPQAAAVLKDNTLVFISYEDYDNYEIKELSPDGALKSSCKLSNYPNPISIDKDEMGRYIFTSQEGYIFKIYPN